MSYYIFCIFSGILSFVFGLSIDVIFLQVKASGMGVVRGETNHPQSFNIYTREAGPGKLSVSFEGPSKAEMAFHDHKVVMEKLIRLNE